MESPLNAEELLADRLPHGINPDLLASGVEVWPHKKEGVKHQNIQRGTNREIEHRNKQVPKQELVRSSTHQGRGGDQKLLQVRIGGGRVWYQGLPAGVSRKRVSGWQVNRPTDAERVEGKGLYLNDIFINISYVTTSQLNNYQQGVSTRSPPHSDPSRAYQMWLVWLSKG